MRMGVLGLVDLSKLVFTLNEVTCLTVLSNTSSKGVIVIDRLGFDDLIVLILGTQAFLKLVVGVVSFIYHTLEEYKADYFVPLSQLKSVKQYFCKRSYANLKPLIFFF